MSKATKWSITVLIAITIFRTQTILFIPALEMNGGAAPNGWLGPWVSDFILGLLVVPVLVLFWARRTRRTWGFLVLYNAVGAFDYSQGLVTQYVSPMPVDMASATAVYGGITVFLGCQLIALGLLFRRGVVEHFNG